ncbi:MAG: FAD-binding oxidoreductase [Thermodesulfobacteriota bacterium]
MSKRKAFLPDWTEKIAPPDSWRSVFKWGAPDGFKHPSAHWYAMMKEEFGLSDADFSRKIREGLEPVVAPSKPALAKKHLDKLKELAGPESVSTDDYSRVKFSYGMTVDEALELRAQSPKTVADAVVHPRNKDDVQKIVAYCAAEKIPLYTYGAGSSVNYGVRTEKGGISLALGTHMNKVLSVNEQNQTAQVQPGMLGPAYEATLNDAPRFFSVKKRYTCGHFPQSFEFSSVGGWVAALGSGQASTYYGDACDILLSLEVVTPAGTIRTLSYPGTATGPKITDMFKGSEGAFGVITELTMKIFRYMPENRRYFGYMFPSWGAAVDCAREMVQGEFGLPAVFRISDAEETDRGLKLYGIPSVVDAGLIRMGHIPGKRCLCLGTCEGDEDYTALVSAKIKKLAKKNGATSLSGYASRKWEKTRFTEPYMREDLNDYGLIIDTLETGVTWDNIHRLHQGVRKVVKARPRTMCMTHASHFYPQGTNLYFIFMIRPENEAEYKDFQLRIVDAIVQNGGSISHHHGVGKMLAPWMETHLGTAQMDVLRALKKHFDPDNIMNPGGQMGLDLEPGRRRK